MRRPTTAAPSADAPREDALRALLVEDPNNITAFAALAEMVRRHAEGDEPVDPLTAEHDRVEHHVSSDVAVWALAEELAGNPRAWYPLIALGRLSLPDDHDGAMRRLNHACERESTGRAVAEGVRVLREADLASDGLGLGVGHWNPKEHIPEAGRQVVLAAVEAGRPMDARRLLGQLAEHASTDAARSIVGELEPQVAAAEAASNH